MKILNKNSLVIYHNSPAIVNDILNDKITILLSNERLKKLEKKISYFFMKDRLKISEH